MAVLSGTIWVIQEKRIVYFPTTTATTTAKKQKKTPFIFSFGILLLKTVLKILQKPVLVGSSSTTYPVLLNDHLSGSTRVANAL